MSRTHREELVFSVWLLSAPAEDQQKWLTARRLPVDELALQLDDYTTGFPKRWWHEQEFAPEFEARVRELDSVLERMSGHANAAHWSNAALYGDPLWANIRQLATSALEAIPANEMGEPTEPRTPR